MNTDTPTVEIKQEIEDFIKRVEKPFQDFILGNQKKYKNYLNNLYHFYYITNYISTQSFLAKGNENVLLNLFTKASLDSLGIYHCLNQGLEIQAQEIARCLYEISVTLELILREDTEERLKLFNDFQYIQRLGQIDFHEETNTEFDINSLRLDPEYLKSLKNKYDEVRNNYHPKNPTSWAWKIFKSKLNDRNPSMLEICKYLGDDFVKEYVMTYPTASLTSHPNQILADYFTKVDGERNVIVNSPNYTNLTKSISCISLSDSAKITINILSYFKIQNFEMIIQYIKMFIAIALDFEKNI